jgi:predicted nucleotidyltransferase
MLSSMQDTLDHATLGDEERQVLERFVEVLRRRLGDEVRAVWLFGSRARGERVADLSDIDVLVIIDQAGWSAAGRVYDALHAAAGQVSLPDVAWSFSLHVRDPGWLDQRRAIGSFFAAEVDRDHIDLTAAA